MAQTSVTILRGADTIGGSCIKIRHGEDSIVLDYGAPLMDSCGTSLAAEVVANPTIANGILLDIQQQDANPPLAYLLSHAHPDHYGLLATLPKGANIYLSDSSYSMMTIGNLFYPEPLRFNSLELCQQFSPGKPFQIGPFTVKAFLMDHSAFGACSLLIEVEGKQVFYTGDFRGHGRKTKVSDYIYSHIKQPDLMLIEGTTLDGGHPQEFPTEASVETAMTEAFSEQGRPAFVVASGSNIDRIVSLYNATKRTGKKLVIDLYQLYLLEALKKHAPGLPPHDGDHLRVIFPKSQLAVIKEKYGNDFLKYSHRHVNLSKLQGTNYVFRVSPYAMTPYLDAFVGQEVKPKFIYSMWLGYQSKQAKFAEMTEQYRQSWQYMHTSGHAYLEHLINFSNNIAAKRLVPVHTLNGDKFVEHFENVHLVKNGEEIIL
ncbi:MBL fold metallo-hydrolase [Shewanella eurypsychrophilus]|uniref:MBL fold metallo-hydrolase n=1 Tax=Shewanella eurypsychrophilus TaxID=2593656 RepID=A0ABX6VAG7_9GAMM|nr:MULTISPECIES: MBL fold metallo-hydrolase [Shewanella]QFU24145.1 MBL fold metallo-hydrolase [Shewanella sp. YLB-09]QPG59352.1 MBL fold metallo-hydrolase [Shewanella eurypsychrophilus]